MSTSRRLNEPLMSPLQTPVLGRQVLDFESECESVLSEVRASFWAIVEYPSLGATKARDLELALKVDAALAWGVFKAGSARSPLEAALFIPGPGSMGKFFKAAGKAGVPEGLIARAQTANMTFLALVERHADDRDIFNAMIADLVGYPDHTAAHIKKQKRNAFRALRYVMGLQVQTMVNTTILHMGERDRVDAVWFTGDIGLRRFRRTVGVRRQFIVRTSTNRLPDTRIEPLGFGRTFGDDTGKTPYTLMTDYFPTDEVEFTVKANEPGGYCSFNIEQRSIGKAGTASYLFGWVERGLFQRSVLEHEPAHYSFWTATPVETFIQDVIVHPDVWDRASPGLALYSDRRVTEEGILYDERDRLPLHEQAELLGTGLACAHTPDIPRYGELLAAAVEQMGWNPREFRVYRTRLEYPVPHTFARMSFLPR